MDRIARALRGSRMAKDLGLAGRLVAITAERRAEDQAVMFRRLGAHVVLAPMMHTALLADPDALRLATVELVDEPPDFLVANTGLGIRAWMQAAEEWGLERPLVEALGDTLIAARGPKAAAAVSSSKLRVWWRSPSEQLAELASHLVQTGLHGKRVACQLHGDDQAEFLSTLRAAGASVIPIPVYRWRPPDAADIEAASRLIERCCAGEVDAITFTAGPQVRNLFAIAEERGRSAELVESFGRRQPLAGCIGPACAAVAVEEGIVAPLVPDNWRLGSLVKAVAAALQDP